MVLLDRRAHDPPLKATANLGLIKNTFINFLYFARKCIFTCLYWQDLQNMSDNVEQLRPN